MAVQIGPVVVNDPVWLAPMTGVSDLPFRKLAKRYGAGMVVSEMIASRAMIMETARTLQMANHEAEEHPMAVQLAGCEPDVMADAAKLNEDRGVAIIDINFGCPVKKVVNGHAGSSLLRDEALAGRILEATARAVSIPVTLKMRTGWDDSNRNAPRVAKIAEEAGIKLLTVHGRTRCQFYKGHADWGFVQQVKDAVKLPVIVNGDITSFDAVDRAMKESGADGVMIGRGSYGRPWFPGQVSHYLRTGEKIDAPSLEEQRSVVIAHYEEMLSYYGVEAGLRIARKHIGWYSAGMHGSSQYRQEVNTMLDPKLVIARIEQFYDSEAEHRATRGADWVPEDSGPMGDGFEEAA